MKGTDRKRLAVMVAFAVVLLLAVVVKPRLGGSAGQNDTPVPLSAQVPTTTTALPAVPVTADPGRDPFKALVDESAPPAPTPPPAVPPAAAPATPSPTTTTTVPPSEQPAS